MSEHDATNAPQSERGPLTEARRGAVLAGAAPSGRSRVCRSCRQPKPVAVFVLLDDPVATQRDWATRHWCRDCLLSGGHITQGQYDHALDPQPEPAPVGYERVHLTREQRSEVYAKIREHKMVAELLDRAFKDETFAAALSRAADNVYLVNLARMHDRPTPTESVTETIDRPA